VNPQQQRYHYLDALRAFAMLLGIVFHVLFSFVEVPIWPAQDIYRSDAHYSFFQHAIHGFRMPLFFVVSGFFTTLLWRRLGAAELIRHRAKRIALPLVIGTLVMWPLLIAASLWGDAKKRHNAASYPHPKITEQPADLWDAAKAGNIEMIDTLLDCGNDPNKSDRFGLSPLAWAALFGQADAAVALLDGGAEMSARDPNGSTPLHAAALLSRTSVAQCLIDRGAAINAVNHWGETPLDRSHTPLLVLATITGLIQMEIDSREVSEGREEIRALLSASDAKSGSDLTPDEKLRQGGSGWGKLFKIYVMGAVFPVFHHLWFLYYLCCMLGLFLCATWLRRKLPSVLPVRLLATPICLIYLIPLTFLPQLYFWQGFGANTAPGIMLWPPKFFYYAIFFCFGAACFGKQQFEQDAGRHWILWSVAALAVLLVGLKAYYAGFHVLASACSATYAWLMVFSCLGLFRRLFSTENSIIRYIADSSYWLYIVHFPLVIALQIAISDWPLPSPVKLILITAVSITLPLISYHYCVRYTVIGRVLNGERRRPNFVGSA
jgi:peptidoglycan/LPS O-acetylase OafA/YrhL